MAEGGKEHCDKASSPKDKNTITALTNYNQEKEKYVAQNGGYLEPLYAVTSSMPAQPLLGMANEILVGVAEYGMLGRYERG